MRVSYTIWDGTQRVRLDPDRIFEELARHLSDSEDLDAALDRLLRDGLGGEEFETVGLDDLLAEVREAIEELLATYNLDHALDRHDERLRDLLEQEQEGLERLADAEERRRRQRELAAIPRPLDEALDRLAEHSFEDPSANRDYEDLEIDGEDIRRLARFVRRWGPRFHGPRDVDFEEALALMERLEALRELESMLSSRSLQGIDRDLAAELLGEDFATSLEQLREILAVLSNAGYLIEKGGRLALTPKAARKLGALALREIFGELLFDATGRHETRRRGASEIEPTETRAYAFGDPMAIDVGASLRNAARRGGGVPIRLAPNDLEVYASRASTRTSTVLLLDMSWSMSWEGRFAAAKKVALAMECMMRTRYPRDYFAVVGFYTRAVEIDLHDLPEVTWNMGDPFTNLQDGLRLASDLLERHPGRNQQMIVITDGQPTAYFSHGRLYCEWPMSIGGLSTRATAETLREVERVSRRGIVINTFMLDDSPPLRAFVEKMTSINKGRAFYTTPDQLGRFLLVDYIGRRRKVL